MNFDPVALSFAFSAGAASAFNPCGAALLPSYLAYLFMRTGSGRSQPGVSNGNNGSQAAGPVQGIIAGALMTLGFLIVFIAGGLAISVAVRAVRAIVPWLTVAIGIGLLIFGVLMLLGRAPAWLNVTMPATMMRSRRGYSAFFFYGIAFAIASLGCTLPIFMVVVAQTFSGGIVQGIIGFVIYSLGMGLVVTALSLGVVLARDTVEKWLYRLLPIMEKIGALLVSGGGLYLVYYWLWGPGAGVR